VEIFHEKDEGNSIGNRNGAFASIPAGTDEGSLCESSWRILTDRSVDQAFAAKVVLVFAQVGQKHRAEE
jgi:hypothetical protein